MNAIAKKPPGVGDFPSHPIHFVIGFLPGGVSDTIARVVAAPLEKELGQRIVVESTPGAGGVVGMTRVVNAKADGYTWYLGQPVLVISKYSKNKPSYNPVKALAPVTLLGTGPTVLVVKPSMPVNTVKELIVLAKSEKQPLQYASSGVGSTNQLAGVLLASMAKIPLTNIPYKGAAASTRAILGGQVPIAFEPLAAAMPFIQNHQLKAIAVTGVKRAKALPDVPTIAETIPGYRVDAWYGLVVPAKTPSAIIRYISVMTNKVLAMPKVGSALLKRGVEVQGSTPAEFAALIRQDAGRWKRLAELGAM